MLQPWVGRLDWVLVITFDNLFKFPDLCACSWLRLRLSTAVGSNWSTGPAYSRTSSTSSSSRTSSTSSSSLNSTCAVWTEFVSLSAIYFLFILILLCKGAFLFVLHHHSANSNFKCLKRLIFHLFTRLFLFRNGFWVKSHYLVWIGLTVAEGTRAKKNVTGGSQMRYTIFVNPLQVPVWHFLSNNDQILEIMK